MHVCSRIGQLRVSADQCQNCLSLPPDFEQFSIGPYFARISQNFMRWTSAASFSEGLTFIFLRISPQGACARELNRGRKLPHYRLQMRTLCL